MAAKASASSGSKSAADDMVKEIARRMRDSILPGDTPFKPSPLKKAAQFVFDTAREREEKHSALGMVSISGERRFLRIAIINDDMPFLVDSIAATISDQGLSIDRLVHPIIPVKRNQSGILTGLPRGKEDDNSTRESMIYIETERVDARQRRELERRLRTTLGDVRAAVEDWPKLQAAVEHWLSSREASVSQFRSMIGRAQLHTPVAPAVLAQIAIQARNLLER